MRIEIDRSDFTELGVKPGHRRRILKKLRQQAEVSQALNLRFTSCSSFYSVCVQGEEKHAPIVCHRPALAMQMHLWFRGLPTMPSSTVGLHSPPSLDAQVAPQSNTPDRGKVRPVPLRTLPLDSLTHVRPSCTYRLAKLRYFYDEFNAIRSLSKGRFGQTFSATIRATRTQVVCKIAHSGAAGRDEWHEFAILVRSFGDVSPLRFTKYMHLSALVCL